MRRLLITAIVLLAFIVGFGAGGYAAVKSYQFTGVVKSIDAKSLTVEKSAKETWEFERAGDTKGDAKVGDRVTVYYKMVASEIEKKPATTTAKKK
jgi:hypothetical protein